MVDISKFRELALSFDEAVELPHFERTSFRVKGKIFATLDNDNIVAIVKLSEVDQSVFCSYDQSVIYPVKGSWGRKGWTTIDLKKVRMDMLKDALTLSYCNVAPIRLAEKYSID